MAGVIATIPKFQFSANGVPMVGGTLETYIAGSTTPATTWQDSALTIANTNPISLDARGECVLWLDPAVVYKFVLKNAPSNGGVVQWTQDNISNPAALRIDLAAPTGAALVGGASQVVNSIAALRALLKTSASKNAFVTGYYSAGDGGGGAYWLDASDNTSPDNGGSVIVASDGGRWKLTQQGYVSVRQFGAKGDGVTDDTVPIQAAVGAFLHVYFPATAPNYYKTTGTITVRSGSRMEGAEQQAPIIGAWGVDGFTVPAGSHGVTFHGLEVRTYTAQGAVDTMVNNGILCAGTGSTSATGVFFVTIDRCYFRGCANAVNGRYLWNSLIHNTTSINCNNGVQLFGQSVNNYITNCNLQANGGNASIVTVKDGAARGEGLMITGCLLASGNYGILSDGFLLMSVTGCTIDLILQKGISLSNAPAFLAHGNWIYANAVGVEFAPLGTAVATGAALSGNYITAPGANGIGVYFGENNVGLSVTGGAIETAVNSRSVISFGTSASVVGVYCANSGANKSIYFSGSDCKALANTGNSLAEWVTVPSQGGQAVATASFAGATGAATMQRNCVTSRTGVGLYSVAFSSPLVSAAYAPIVTIDRGGNGAMGYAVTSQTSAGFSFTVTNQAGTAQDPGSVWVAVFN